MHEETFLAGMGICLINCPVPGSQTESAAPPHKATHKRPSVSEVMPSGQPNSAGTSREVKKIAPKMRMPGFRPGKVPANLVKKMHGEALHADVAREADVAMLVIWVEKLEREAATSA